MKIYTVRKYPNIFYELDGIDGTPSLILGANPENNDARDLNGKYWKEHTKETIESFGTEPSDAYVNKESFNTIVAAFHKGEKSAYDAYWEMKNLTHDGLVAYFNNGAKGREDEEPANPESRFPEMSFLGNQ